MVVAYIRAVLLHSILMFSIPICFHGSLGRGEFWAVSDGYSHNNSATPCSEVGHKTSAMVVKSPINLGGDSGESIHGKSKGMGSIPHDRVMGC